MVAVSNRNPTEVREFLRGFGRRRFPRATRSPRGLPGFIKQLVDECALGDITQPGRSATKYRSGHCGIERLDIYQGQIFI